MKLGIYIGSIQGKSYNWETSLSILSFIKEADIIVGALAPLVDDSIFSILKISAVNYLEPFPIFSRKISVLFMLCAKRN